MLSTINQHFIKNNSDSDKKIKIKNCPQRRKKMKLAFYGDMEFIKEGSIYDVDDAQTKFTYYIQILNQISNIIEWLRESIDTIKNSPNENFIFRNFSNINIDSIVLYLIKKELRDAYNKEKDTLHTMKEYYKVLETKDEQEHTEHSKNELSKLNDRIIRQENRLLKKDFLILDVINISAFLATHRDRVEYFILKEPIFNEKISKNEIESIFSSKVDLPSYSKELYFEKSGTIKNVQTIYNKVKDLKEEEKKTSLDNFFRNTDFHFLNKYEIKSIYELMNIYFNEALENKIRIRKCKNCGRYFLVHNKQLFCDNPSPQNENITCRKLSDDIKEKSDKIYQEYRNAYKKQHNKLSRYISAGNISEQKLRERFKKWDTEARVQKETCKTVKEYQEWYNTSLNWIKDYK